MVKPILFNTDMVRAILEGRKTVTRRLIKPQPKGILCYTMAGNGHGKWTYPSPETYRYWGDKYKLPDDLTDDDKSRVWAPPCHTDDILYVRETWNYGYFESSDVELDNTRWFEEVRKGKGGFLDGISHYIYRADFTKSEEIEYGTEDNSGKIKMCWKPSIHMPKEAARIFLRVTNVSVAKLQDMTEDDVAKEGVPGDIDYPISSIYCPYCKGEGLVGTLHSGTLGYMEVECNHCDTRIKRFKNLWDFTIKQDIDKYGWSANPWVWVIEFERTEKPNEWV